MELKVQREVGRGPKDCFGCLWCKFLVLFIGSNVYVMQLLILWSGVGCVLNNAKILFVWIFVLCFCFVLLCYF